MTSLFPLTVLRAGGDHRINHADQLAVGDRYLIDDVVHHVIAVGPEAEDDTRGWTAWISVEFDISGGPMMGAREKLHTFLNKHYPNRWRENAVRGPVTKRWIDILFEDPDEAMHMKLAWPPIRPD